LGLRIICIVGCFGNCFQRLKNC